MRSRRWRRWSLTGSANATDGPAQATGARHDDTLTLPYSRISAPPHRPARGLAHNHSGTGRLLSRPPVPGQGAADP